MRYHLKNTISDYTAHHPDFTPHTEDSRLYRVTEFVFFLSKYVKFN